MKASNGANIFFPPLVPKTTSQTGLFSEDGGDGNPRSLSHVTFCYDRDIRGSKTAAGTYTRTHAWSVDKSVTPTKNNGFQGDVLSWTWTITVSETRVDSEKIVTGSITVANPSLNDIDIVVTDAIDTNSGTVTCPETSGKTTVAASDSVTCTYTVTLPNNYNIASGGTNTATITATTSTGITISTTATSPAIVFTQTTTVRGSATLTDDLIAISKFSPTVPSPIVAGATAGTWTFTASDSHTCSTNRGSPYVNGHYGNTLINTATLTPAGSSALSAQAQTQYECTCNTAGVAVFKQENGATATSAYTFNLKGNSVGGSAGIPSSGGITLQTIDGVADFDTAALSPADKYTLCEMNLPAGTGFTWTVRQGTVLYTFLLPVLFFFLSLSYLKHF